MPNGYTDGGGLGGGGAGEAEEGFAGGVVEDFHVGPGDVAAPAGAEDFEDGFLGGEAAGEVDGGEFVGEAVGLFGGGEAAVEEMAAVVGVEARDAVHFDDIDAVSDDGHGGDCPRGGAGRQGETGRRKALDSKTGRQGEEETRRLGALAMGEGSGTGGSRGGRRGRSAREEFRRRGGGGGLDAGRGVIQWRADAVRRRPRGMATGGAARSAAAHDGVLQR